MALHTHGSHTGAQPTVDNQPPVNTQGFTQGMGFSQPVQFGSRNLGGFPPGIGFLQQLLGREERPTLPPVQQVSRDELRESGNQAARGGDLQRTRILRQLLQQRLADSDTPSVGPKGPEVASAGARTSAESDNSLNPFDKAAQALGEALLRSQQ